MNSAILIGMAILLILFVWTWIMVSMLQRMSLEKKIEKLNNGINSNTAACPYDQQNLLWSGKALLRSVSLRLWETIERDVGVSASGPVVFESIVSIMQGRQRNLLNHEIVEAFVPVIEHLKKEKKKGQLKGIIITSRQKTS